MKTLIYSALIVLLLVIPTLAQDQQAMDGDDLRKLLNATEREHYGHSKELKSDEMHLLLKRRKEREAAEKAAREAAAARDRQRIENGEGTGDEKAGRAANGSSGQAGNEAKASASSATGNEASITAGNGTPGGSESKGKGKNRKSRNASSTAAAASGKHAGNRAGRGGDRYVPFSLQALKGKAKLGGFQADSREKKNGPYFGIRMGTKIRARLPQVTTNVEQNLSEVVIEQDVFGDFKTMPRTTKLYAKKSLNSGSNRLELLVVKGITPQGEEFKIKGIVLDINSSAGLVGAVSTDGKAVQRSVAAGVFGLGKDLAPILNDGTVVGAGVEAAAKNMMDEKEDETDASLNKPQYIIYVNPQDIQIRVEETF